MKLRLLSDLHVEFKQFELTELDSDKDSILILAGDIGAERNIPHLLNQWVPRFKAIIYVLGNHEYYYNDLYKTRDHFRSLVSFDNVYIIDEPEVLNIEGIKFLCGTLWTDANKSNEISKQHIIRYLNDYRLIGKDDGPIYIEDTIEIHNRTIEFFKEHCDEQTVIVTHHMPSDFCVHDKYRSENNFHINYGFKSDLDDFILQYKPKFWLYGHGHDSSDFQLGNTRLVSNPRGYPRGIFSMENELFNQELVLEMAVDDN